MNEVNVSFWFYFERTFTGLTRQFIPFSGAIKIRVLPYPVNENWFSEKRLR